MRRLILSFIAILCCFMPALDANATNMALTKDGTLFRIILNDEGMLLTSSSPDGTSYSSLVPQTTGADISSVSIGIDETSLIPYILWQEGTAENARVFLATYIKDVWTGPIAIDSESFVSARNPQMIVRRETTSVDVETEIEGNDGEPEIFIETINVEATILHTVWWSQFEGDDAGVGIYAAIPVLDDGTPHIEEALVTQLGDLLPYGIGCSGIHDTDALSFPKLFVDPASGRVNVFSTDYANCLFQIIEMEYHVADWNNLEKRGRHSIILGRTEMIAINPDLVLGGAAVKVGRNLSVVVYRDVANAIEYTQLDEQGWSKTQRLELSEELNHEQAVNLIDALTR